ncbi:MAG: HlyD family secretion protein [Pseudonocardiales bacterium]|nr:HlyD family secretion protein [Pseudonocardiales bacterium]
MSRHRTPGGVTNRWQSQATRRTAWGGVAIALVASGVVACTASNTAAQPRTYVVQRTSVTSGVSATGSLTSVTEQNLGFLKGGQLTAVNVKVGDHVTAGQVLATTDPFSAQQELSQAQSQLRAQQALLDKITNSPVVSGSQDTLDQARKILQRTEDQADAVQSADQTAIDNAKRQLDQAQRVLDRAKDQLRSDQAACGMANVAASAPVTGTGMTTGTGTTTGTTGTGLTSLAGALALGTASAMSAVTTPAACTAVPTDQAAVTTAKSTVVADQGAVDAAESKKDVDDESGRLAVANAQQGVVSAQNATNSATSDRPPSIAQQAAAVAAAQSVVASANRDVDNTTLRAPVDGVVSVLNGAVGEFVAPSTGTSALAPGTDATLPGTDGTSGAAAAGAATPTRPGGTQFLVLDNIDEFQVVLAFTETDAANITPGQKVKVTFDAVPDLTLDGSVLSSAPTGTAISGVISYYVTVVLPKSDLRLRSGMTAEAEVLTKEIPDVLAVPSASVHTQSGRSTVTVLESDGTQRAIPVQTGATGDGNTQILTGLTEGQQVVLPATP